jgi:antitoxin (DNA-binding transcriptional repressor) of toxin-antitoxin stability system
MIWMKVVGVRELKNRLSQYLQMARKGEYVLVTDRGQVVAEIRQADSAALGEQVPAGLAALVSRGIVSLGTDNDAGVYPRMKRIPGAPSALKLLDDERREG